eukprot:4448007-Prymnesium_polylepis.1
MAAGPPLASPSLPLSTQPSCCCTDSGGRRGDRETRSSSFRRVLDDARRRRARRARADVRPSLACRPRPPCTASELNLGISCNFGAA